MPRRKMPLILVGNKSDTEEISLLIDSVLSIMNDFPEVRIQLILAIAHPLIRYYPGPLTLSSPS